MRSLLRIAFRNTGRQKKRTLLLAGAIAFGVVVVTLLNGFTGGASRNIERVLTDLIGGHVYVSGTQLTDSRLIINVIRDWEDGNSPLADVVGEVEGQIADLNRRSRTLGTLIFGSKQTNQFLDGVDWHGEASFFPSLSLTAGSLPGPDDRNALILPEAAAERLRVEVGDQVLVRVSTVTGQQNVGELVLAATIEDSGITAFSSAFVRLDYMGELIGTGAGEFQVLNLYLRDPRQSGRVAEVLRARLPTAPEDEQEEVSGQPPGTPGALGAGVNRLADDEEPWEGTRYEITTLDDILDQVSDLFGVLDIVSLVVFLILLTITMVGVVNTFRMVLLERIREIGTMRAVGMQGRSVRGIFLMEAGFIGLIGALIGLVLAGIAMLVLGQLTLDTDSPLQFFLNDGRITFAVPPLSVVTNVAILLALSLLAAFIPARRAARMEPAAALRSSA
ncbi:MAG: FtsX-like permease family protein [Spirochaetaceae bacterium]|nr:FtsX-like permease family protein [Spirochaetaceae bacterium]